MLLVFIKLFYFYVKYLGRICCCCSIGNVLTSNFCNGEGTETYYCSAVPYMILEILMELFKLTIAEKYAIL